MFRSAVLLLATAGAAGASDHGLLRTAEEGLDFCTRANSNPKPGLSKTIQSYRLLSVPLSMVTSSANNSLDMWWAEKLCCLFTRVQVGGDRVRYINYDGYEINFQWPAFCQVAQQAVEQIVSLPDGAVDKIKQADCLAKYVASISARLVMIYHDKMFSDFGRL